MPTMKNSGDLITSISTDLADNNAGLISAEDVRHNMEDTVFSINKIVCSGDTATTFPFYNNVRARQVNTGDATEGIFIAESGIQFPNWPVSVVGIANNTQIQPFPGIQNLNHNDLNFDDSANPHTGYYKTDGTNACTDDFVLGNNWINASGYSDMGFKFVPVGPGKDQEIYTSGTLRFSDQSTIENGKGFANAWVQFDGSGTVGNKAPAIRSYHGISGIIKLNPGKYKIIFDSGVFSNSNFVAVGTANATTASGSKEDMVVNTVGFVMREPVGNNAHVQSTTVAVRTESGDYVDSELIDCVFYGLGVNETSGTPSISPVGPTTGFDPNYADP